MRASCRVGRGTELSRYCLPSRPPFLCALGATKGKSSAPGDAEGWPGTATAKRSTNSGEQALTRLAHCVLTANVGLRWEYGRPWIQALNSGDATGAAYLNRGLRSSKA
jgi:hypothetical protein